MNSEELTHKAEEEIAALISKKVAPNTTENRARGFRNRVRAAAKLMKGRRDYHVKIKLLYRAISAINHGYWAGRRQY